MNKPLLSAEQGTVRQSQTCKNEKTKAAKTISPSVTELGYIFLVGPSTSHFCFQLINTRWFVPLEPLCLTGAAGGCGSFPCSVTSDQIPLWWHRRVQQRCSNFQAQPQSRRCEVSLTPGLVLQFKSWKEQETGRQGPAVWALCTFWVLWPSCPTAPNPNRSLLLSKF